MAGGGAGCPSRESGEAEKQGLIRLLGAELQPGRFVAN